MTENRNAYSILCVDDEEPNLVTLRYAFEDRFHILTARSGEEALDILTREPVAVLLCDQRMPNMTGVELCKRALELRPQVTRMLITAYSDVDAVISAINLGQVSRFLLKPWRPKELEQVLRDAIEVAQLKHTIGDLERRLLSTFPQRLTLAASAAVVHELSNPLAAMTMAAAEASKTIDHLMTEVHAPADSSVATELRWLKDLHDEFGAGLNQVNTMLRRMRNGAKADSITGRCDLKVVLDSVVRIVRRQVEPHASLQIVCDSSIEVGLDPSVVAEIIINLLLSASQSIEAARLQGRTIRVEGHYESAEPTLSVVDDGPGLASEHLEYLFDARFTPHGDGRGLGLLIVHDLVQRAGGTIRVESQLHAGTRFNVRLPRSFESLCE